MGDEAFESIKPNYSSNSTEREQYIRQKYIEKLHLQPLEINGRNSFSPQQLNEMLYENVETTDCGKTLHLILLGANPNYSQKMFSVADHAKRHQQIKQMKIILTNGGKRTKNECLYLLLSFFLRHYLRYLMSFDMHRIFVERRCISHFELSASHVCHVFEDDSKCFFLYFNRLIRF